MSRRATTTSVTLPVRLKVDKDAIEHHQDTVDAALRSAVGRAVANSKKAVPAPTGHASLVEIEVAWTGPFRSVALDKVATLDDRIRASVRRVAKDAGLVDRTNEPLATAPAAPQPIDLQASLARLQSASVSERGIAFLEIRQQVVAGDEAAFFLALMAIRPDDASPTTVALQALRELWESDPDRFRTLLEQAATTWRPGTIRRSDRDIFVDDDLRTGLGPLLGAIARVMEAIPEVGRARDLDKRAPGLGRVTALLDALREVWVSLGETVERAGEPTDARHLAAARERPQNTQNLAGLLVALSDDERTRKIVAALEPDLLETIRWLGATVTALRTLAGELALYRDAFGTAAPVQEEVVALLEARALLIRLAVENPLPTAELARALERQVDGAVGSWRFTAAQRRLHRLRSGVAEVATLLESVRLPNPYYERMMEWDPLTDIRVSLAGRLERMRLELGDLAATLDVAGERALDLETLLGLERRLAFASLRIPILGAWAATIELEKYTYYPYEIGTSSQRGRWQAELEQLRREFQAAYDDPNFETIEERLEWWGDSLRTIESQLNARAKVEFVENVAINIAALLITAKVAGGGGGAGLSLTRVTLAEAATFTAVTTVGKVVLLDKTFNPSETLNEFVDTFILFGAFKIMNVLVTAGALRLFRGQPVAQLALIVGTNVVAATGLPLLAARLSRPADEEEHHWTEQEAAAVATGLVINAIAVAVSGPKMLAELQRVNAVMLRSDLIALRADAFVWARQMRTVLDEGAETPAQFRRLQKDGIGLCDRVQTVLERLAALSDETLAGLGTTKGYLLDQAANVGDWRARFASMEPLEMQEHLALLPPPTAAGEAALVPVGAGVYQYDPSSRLSNAAALTRRLRAAGYTVRSEAGVLFLSAGPNEPSRFRLLPAPAAPPAAVRSSASAETESLVLNAAGPGSPAVRELLARPAGESLLAAAQLEPELVRRAILSEPSEEKLRLVRLEQALRDAGMAETLIDQAVSAVGVATSARRSAAAAAPAAELLLLAGGGPRAREVLATPDGRALVEAATRAPGATRAALVVPDMLREGAKTEAVHEWRDHGVPDDRVAAATHGLDALLAAKATTVLSPAEEIVAAAGGSSAARSRLEALAKESPSGHAALLAAAENEPALVRAAIRASEHRTLIDSTSELVRRLQAEGVPHDDIIVVGKELRLLNEDRRVPATKVEELAVRAERVRGLYDDDAFRRDAAVVVSRFRSPRKERAEEWLQRRIGGASGEVSDTYYLARDVDASPALSELAGHGGDIMLRQLWTMYRAGRTRKSKLTFAEYVDALQRIHRGLHGEYAFTFWVGDDYIVLKAPDAGVTVPGTDIVLVPRGGGAPIWVDQKALAARVVDSVSALTRNLPKNVVDDLDLMEGLLASGNEYPPELLSALPVQREASARIAKITQGLTKEQVDSVPVQQQIDAELKKLGIRRVVATEGGASKELSSHLVQIGFDLWPDD